MIAYRTQPDPPPDEPRLPPIDRSGSDPSIPSGPLGPTVRGES
jgi:hypothetical protein